MSWMFDRKHGQIAKCSKKCQQVKRNINITLQYNPCDFLDLFLSNIGLTEML